MIVTMLRFICFLITVCIGITPAHAATARGATTRATESAAAARTANPAAGYNYNYMYPYLNNQMKTVLNPGVTTSQNINPIDTIVRTEQLSAPRRVVPRAARSATATNTTAATSVATAPRAAQPAATSTRRIVARRATQPTTARAAARSTRGDATYVNQSAANSPNRVVADGTNISSARCLADYTECMNGYCARENTKYNRCYCSARLSQIDAQYQPQIDSLIRQILSLQGTNRWSAAEMNEYWMSTVGKYTGDNSWTDLENALNIDWAGTESRVRGQQAFATGHDYCAQHLRGCYYMAPNLRDAYRSEIARDCTNYEQSLMRLKNVAESLIEANQ